MRCEDCPWANVDDNGIIWCEYRTESGTYGFDGYEPCATFSEWKERTKGGD